MKAMRRIRAAAAAFPALMLLIAPHDRLRVSAMWLRTQP